MLSNGALLMGGNLVIERQLSSGGFGNTYVVKKQLTGEILAMKEFFMKGVNLRKSGMVTVSVPDNKATFESQRAKFEKEARRLSKIDNEHIVKVHDLFYENGTVYYTMDYINGESLKERLERTHMPLNEKEVCDILEQLLDALSSVHSQGIYHLDIKPNNIMQDKQGHVYLIDFGASKQLELNGNDKTSSLITHTPGYAPTEQISQELSKIGAWTDIYALGATLYNLLTNISPSTIEAGENPTYPTPVSAEMQELIARMLRTKRSERPQSVNDIKKLRDELKNAKKISETGGSSDKEDVTRFDSEPKPIKKKWWKYLKNTLNNDLASAKSLWQREGNRQLTLTSLSKWNLYLVILTGILSCGLALYATISDYNYREISEGIGLFAFWGISVLIFALTPLFIGIQGLYILKRGMSKYAYIMLFLSLLLLAGYAIFPFYSLPSYYTEWGIEWYLVNGLTNIHLILSYLFLFQLVYIKIALGDFLSVSLSDIGRRFLKVDRNIVLTCILLGICIVTICVWFSLGWDLDDLFGKILTIVVVISSYAILWHRRWGFWLAVAITGAFTINDVILVREFYFIPLVPLCFAIPIILVYALLYIPKKRVPYWRNMLDECSDIFSSFLYMTGLLGAIIMLLMATWQDIDGYIEVKKENDFEAREKVNPTLPENQLTLALKYLNGTEDIEKNEQEAVRWLTAASDQGNVEAKFLLGKCYLDGIGVEQNDTLGCDFIRTAASEKVASAYALFGDLCYYGRGMEKDLRRALDNYKVGAEKGDTAALYRLGLFYENNDNSRLYTNSDIIIIHKDNKEGYVKKAYDMNNTQPLSKRERIQKSDSCYRILAKLNHVGGILKLAEHTNYKKDKVRLLEKAVNTGGEVSIKLLTDAWWKLGDSLYLNKNYSGAVTYFKKAVEKNDSASMVYLGKCYYNGHGEDKDDKKAFSLFNKSNNSLAQAYCYYYGIGTDKDEIKAKELFLKSSGYEESCYDPYLLLGNCYYYGRVVDKNELQAVEYWKNAANRGNKYAQFHLGFYYRYKDWKEAAIWLKKSADQKYKEAYYWLADLYHYGYGGEKNESLYKYWMEKYYNK